MSTDGENDGQIIADQIYHLFQGNLYELNKQYIHCSEIIQFFWFLFVFLMLVTAILRTFVLKVDVNSKDGLYTKYGGEPIQNASQIKQNPPAANEKATNAKSPTKSPIKQQKKDVKAEEKSVPEQNVIKIDQDDDDAPKQQQQKNDDIIKDIDIDVKVEEKSEDKQESDIDQAQNQRRDEEDQNSFQQPSAGASSNLGQQVSKPEDTDKQAIFCEFVEQYVDFHLPVMSIGILLIGSWASYIYSTFIIFVVFLSTVFINRFKVIQSQEMQKNLELGYHGLLLTLFLNYWINDQSYE